MSKRKFLAVLTLGLALSFSASASFSATSVAPTSAKCISAASDPCSDFVVIFKPGLSQASISSMLTVSNAQVKREFTNVFSGASVTGPLSKMQALAKNPNILLVEADLTVTANTIQSSAPWGLDRINQRTLPLDATFDDLNNQGSGSSIYVVDTGIDTTNLDFGTRVKPGYTAIVDGKGTLDCNGHGTHVSGIAAGAKYGVAKAANLVPVRVLDCAGSGSYSNVISGLDYVASQYTSGAKFVVNMSLGGAASSSIDSAVQSLIAKGINVVVAAGNSNADACKYSPSRVPEAITVGATTNLDARASYSNYGTCLDVFAPGTNITSDWLGASGVNTISGTSMASPAVAGVVARFISVNSGLTPAQVATSLKTGSTKNVLSSIGNGSVNALVYLEFAPDLTSPTTSPSTNPVGKNTGKK